MAQHLTLSAQKREASGTGKAKKLRREGIVPAVIYGAQQDNYSIQVSAKDFGNALKTTSSENFLVNLEIEGAREKTKLAMVQAYQQDPITGQIIHIDFHTVREGEKVHAHVPVEVRGEARGVKEGGVLDHQLHAIDIHCNPADLPDHLTVDISKLAIGESVVVGDIAFPSGVETSMDKDIVVAIVTKPRVATEEEVAAEAAAEPELVGADEEEKEGESSED